MSQRSLSTNQQPLATFMARKAEIDDLLGHIQASSADHFYAQPDEVHWGHVGSLGHVAEQLRAVAAFLAVLRRHALTAPLGLLPAGLGVVAPG